MYQRIIASSSELSTAAHIHTFTQHLPDDHTFLSTRTRAPRTLMEKITSDLIESSVYSGLTEPFGHDLTVRSKSCRRNQPPIPTMGAEPTRLGCCLLRAKNRSRGRGNPDRIRMPRTGRAWDSLAVRGSQSVSFRGVLLA